MNEKAKLYALPEPIIINQRANPKYGDASISEIRRSEADPNMRGYYRVIGGDNGDVLFNGYAAEGAKVTLKDPVLRTTLADLDKDEIFEIVQEIVQYARQSIGLEAIGSIG